MSIQPLLESPPLLILLAVMGFMVMWAAVSCLIAAVSGWRRSLSAVRD